MMVEIIIIDLCLVLVGFCLGVKFGSDMRGEQMSKAEYDKIVHLMNHGALQGINTGRLDGKCEDVIPLEDAIAIVDLVYKEESGKKYE